VMGNKPSRDVNVDTTRVEIPTARSGRPPRNAAIRIASPQSRPGSLRLSVGLDVVSVAEISAALDRFGRRYIDRVFTAQEAAYCRASATTAAHLAVRFAAKEAAVKALQPDWQWTDWRAIEVKRHKSGRCALVLHREAASLASRRGIRNFALSMSHDGDCAAAIVVALRDTIQRPER
jgi:holo-[acyl-carrier protein] synthase